jgi:hypothetical protein
VVSLSERLMRQRAALRTRRCDEGAPPAAPTPAAPLGRLLE